MTTDTNPLRRDARRDSAMMLGALGILAYAASMMTHEALGHGGFCVAVGGHNGMLTAWGERCEFPGDHPSGIEATGPGAQFGAGLLAWWVLHLISSKAPTLRYFIWLYMVFNLLVSAGYVAFSGVTDFGDAAVIISGLSPVFVWRGGLILLGSLVYFLSMRAAAQELKRFAGRDDRRSRLLRLVLIPYITAGAFACCVGALNRSMGHGVAIGLAAASSFGGGLGILFLPAMLRDMPSNAPTAPVYVLPSIVWGTVVAVVIFAFVFFIGPGID